MGVGEFNWLLVCPLSLRIDFRALLQVCGIYSRGVRVSDAATYTKYINICTLP